MRNKRATYFLKTLLPLAFPVLLLPSCRKEEEAAPRAMESHFSLLLEEEGAPPTRSLLNSADIETKITSVTLGLYQGGTLVESEQYGSGFDQMAFPLEDGTYSAYALVNMGDMREALPEDESDLPSLTYSIPGYLDQGTGIEYRGIPMAGHTSYTVGVSQSGEIPIKRLMAKVTANLSCEWTGTITSVKVCNLNGKLKPFGSSAAGSADDILPEQEYQAGGDAASGSFVFYVPENLQGSVAGIPSSADKSPEGSAEVSARSSCMTYLETLVKGNSGVEGSITYRSFLGEDAVSDFDIRRNWRYTWDIRFLPDGRLQNNWKHENGLTWSEYRYSIAPTRVFLYLGESQDIQVNRHEDRYIHGTFHANATAPQNYGSHFSWSYASLDNPSVRNDNAVIAGSLQSNGKYSVVATGSGTRRVSATGPEGSEAQTLSCDVTAMGYFRKLLMIADPGPRAVVGESIRLKVLVYTIQNGITSLSEDVTNKTGCTIFRGTVADYNPIKMLSQGVLSATGEGRERFNADYNYPGEGKTLHASGLYIIYEASRTGSLSISGAAGGTVGGSLQLQAAFTRDSSTTDVSSQVSWSVLDGNRDFGISVSASGVVSSSKAGAGVVQAKYEIDGKDYYAQTIVTFNAH